MNLHRSDNEPDWSNVNVAEYSLWQKIAAATHGIVTPANIVTIIGLGLVVTGLVMILQHHYWLGSGVIIAGRLLDLVDGWLAELTQTKSPLGELLDAVIDKIGTVLTILVLYIAALAPWWLLTAMLLPHIIISIISLYARRRKKQLHPSRLGKLSMAILWMGLFGFVILRAIDATDLGVLFIAVYFASIVSVLMSAFAAIKYAYTLKEA